MTAIHTGKPDADYEPSESVLEDVRKIYVIAGRIDDGELHVKDGFNQIAAMIEKRYTQLQTDSNKWANKAVELQNVINSRLNIKSCSGGILTWTDVLDLREKAIRDGLIELGWTPPKEES